MEKVIKKKAKTHAGISQVLEEHQTDWASFSPMVEAKAEFDLLMNKSSQLTQVLQEESGTASLSKKLSKVKMKTGVEFLYNAIMALADAKKDEAFMNQLKVQWTKFYGAATDIELYNTGLYLYSLAEGRKTDLVDYKVNQGVFDDVLKAINQFYALINLPKTVIKSKKQTAEYLKNYNKQISVLLKNRIDKLVKILAVEFPEFGDKYFAMRPLAKNKSKKKKDQISDGQANNEASA